MYAQSGQDLLLTLRREIDDLAASGDPREDADRLWKTDELYGYLDEGQQEWARRTRALLTTVELPVVASANTLTLPAWVVDVLEGSLLVARTPVTQLNRNEAAQPKDDYGTAYTLYDDYSEGQPKFMVLDAITKQLVLIPIPVASDTLRLRVVSLPKLSFKHGANAPSVDSRDIRLILNWAKYLAYDKQDMETLDKSQSDGFRAKFEADVKVREQEINRLRRRPGAVRYGGL